ncbi:MAG: hypothetical protein SNH01_07580 [Rikenellaceae bacterium]
MKRILNIIIATTVLFAVSCEKNELTFQANEFSDVSVINSHIVDEFGSVYIDVGSAVNFMDLSVGATSHVWEISENTNFLTGSYSLEDSDFSANIVEGETTSKDITIGVLFPEPGAASVRLFNLFKDPVSFFCYEGANEVTINSEWSDEYGANVFDYSTNLIVVDSVRVGYTVYDWNGDEIMNIGLDDWAETTASSDTWQTVDVPAGKGLTFRVSDECDASRYDGISWAVSNGDPIVSPSLTSKEFTATYSTTTSSYVNAGSLTLSRATGSNSNFKLTASSRRKVIPLRIKVIEPTDVFTVTSATSVSGENFVTIPLGVPVSNMLSRSVASEVLNAVDFTITGTNIYGEPLSMTVDSVEFDSTDDEDVDTSVESYYTQIIVTFSDAVYADDKTLKLSYNGDSIVDMYGRTLQPFDIDFTPEVVSYTADWADDLYSFEDSGEYNSQSTHKAFALSEEVAAVGSTSLHYSKDNFDLYGPDAMGSTATLIYYMGSSATRTPITFITGETYVCYFNVYFREGLDDETLRLRVKTPSSTASFNITFEFDTNDSRNWNKWHAVEVEMDMSGSTFTDIGDSFDSYMSILFTNNYGLDIPETDFFVDNFSVYNKNKIYREKDPSEVTLGEIENGGNL